MSEDNIDAKVENATTNDAASDRDTAVDRHDDADCERGESVRDAIKSAWREQTGEEPEDSREDRRKRDEERERRQMERRGERSRRSAR